MHRYKLLWVLGITLLLFLLSGCYYLTQGCNLIGIYSKAEDIDTLLAKHNLPPDELHLLDEVKKIKAYATDVLGLAKDKNYSTYIKINKDYLADVVSACESDSFSQKTWDYLFIGPMPYQGFFNLQDAKQEALRLKKQGYDVYVRRVDAFSTLGFFRDPIFSFMKDYPIYDLADLIIHEQTHATIFLNNNVDFSENLAQFFGSQGAKQYIKDTYGEESELFKTTLRDEQDITAYFTLLKKLYHELDALYKENITKEQKLQEKALIINRWKQDFAANYAFYFKTADFKRVPELEINNAFLATQMNYTSNLALFYDLYAACSFNLKSLMEVVKNLKDYHGDAFEYVRNYINSVKSGGQ
jgi:predicted aminopeptidase